jgi:hypothetical protein
MKFLSFVTVPAGRLVEVSAAADKGMANPPPGYQVLANYACLAAPFDGIPPNSFVSVSISETDNVEALAAIQYPLLLAGATVHRVPIMDVAIGTAVQTEKEFRG